MAACGGGQRMTPLRRGGMAVVGSVC